MRAGRLRYLVEIEHRVASRDAAGEPLLVWSNFATRRAAIDPAGGSESVTRGKTEARQTVNIVFRYVENLRCSMRIRHVSSGRVFEIIDIKTDRTMMRNHIVRAEEVTE